jgi:heptosyltransferase-2
VSDEDRITMARRLADAWPRRAPKRGAAAVRAARTERPGDARLPRNVVAMSPLTEEPDWLHADRFSSLPPLLAVHFGAGSAAKRWPARAWKVLVERFLGSGWRVVVVGGIDDVPLSSVLEPHEWLRDWTGTMSVAETTAFLERADLFIGADSGPAHMAASAGTLSVILFSGTNHPRQWRPWSRHALVLRHRVPCHPCHQKVCPLAGHPCMSGLHPDRVYRGAMRWWARTHGAQSPHPPLSGLLDPAREQEVNR